MELHIDRQRYMEREVKDEMLRDKEETIWEKPSYCDNGPKWILFLRPSYNFQDAVNKTKGIESWQFSQVGGHL